MQIEVGLKTSLDFGLVGIAVIGLFWAQTINFRLKLQNDLHRRLVTVENIEERGLSPKQEVLFHQQGMSFQLSAIVTMFFIATMASLITS